MKKVLLVLLLFSFSIAFAQEEDAWVYLEDKPNSASFISNPTSILSQRALDRRTNQGIALDSKDAPVETTYYNSIVNATGITVLAKSKWLNALYVRGSQNDIQNLEITFSFVKSIDFANKSLNSRGTSSTVISNHQGKLDTTQNFDYGNAFNQIEMLKGDFLHEQGYTGQGMVIAVIDAGFPNVDTSPAFQRLRDNNQILGGYNFVDRNDDFYSRNSHGSHVLSDIGGYLENEFVGTAPDASFYLFISEDAQNELPLEESLWVEAAERSDSLGVDVINTSLGYSTFDNSNYNYTYDDMDGKTTFISRGAEIAATRGMILVNSAGNSGGSAWFYVTAPADADGILTVGSVDANGVLSSFSSRGPTSDNRTKPDVMAQGSSASIINYNTGVPDVSNGTSFSSPIMAGVVACFWQAFPDQNVPEILEAIRMSSDRSGTSDNEYGYGIPDFQIAFSTLSTNSEALFESMRMYPNPAKNIISFSLTNDFDQYQINIYNILGKKVEIHKNLTSNTIDISNLKNGVYIVKIVHEKKSKTLKLIKR
jgi:subtilisin family serine protease